MATPLTMAPPTTFTPLVSAEHPRRAWVALPALWPPLAALGLLLVLVWTHAAPGVSANGGRLVYPIDDIYGHMAVAKNLARHGIWGFSAAEGFASGASSLLWPLLLAGGFALFGVNEWSPLALNLALAAGLVFLGARILRRYTASGVLQALILGLVVVLTPLPAVVFSGMEHVLQTLLDVAFVYLAARLLAGECTRPGAARGLLPVLACLLTMARFEGLFLVAVVCLLFGFRRRWFYAVGLGAGAVAPVVGFGLISVSKGWAFLPNSLLLKGNTQVGLTWQGLKTFALTGWNQLGLNPHMSALVWVVAAALAAELLRGRTLWRSPALILAITLAATALHLQFAGLGWFFRYEAYLVVLGLLGLGVALVSREAGEAALPRRAWLLAHAAVLALAWFQLRPPLWERARLSLEIMSPASTNVFQQQYQMGLFLRDFYPGAGVAANDIGAINFLGDIRLFDTYGLANMEVMRAKRRHAYDHDVVRAGMARHGTRVIAVYDTWSGEYGGTLPEWVPVGRWTIPDNRICGSETVSFYAPNAAEAPALTRALQEFAPRLPAAVRQSGAYRGDRETIVSGTYGPEAEPGGTLYWVKRQAGVTLYPPAGQEDGATLTVDLLSGVPGVRVEFFVNDASVHTETLKPEQLGTWVPVTVRARWREGQNTLRLVGHGEPVQPPGDGRKLLFSLRGPRWADPAALSP